MPNDVITAVSITDATHLVEPRNHVGAGVQHRRPDAAFGWSQGGFGDNG